MLGLLRSPPVVDGWVVKPVLGSSTPNIGYFKSFVAWRAYTSPRQLHVELGLLAAELVLVLGVFGFLLPITGLTDSVLDPILRRRDTATVDRSFMLVDFLLYGGSIQDNDFSFTAASPLSVTLLHYLAVVSLVVNCAALGAVLLTWVGLVFRTYCWPGCSSRSPRNRVANFLYLWVANAAGVAELVLVNACLGPPTPDALDMSADLY